MIGLSYMSRIESGKVDLNEEYVDSKAIFDSIETMIIPLAKEKNVTLDIDLGTSDAPYIKMDILRTKQVYLNLLNNAIKFSEPGGIVEWKIRYKRIDDDKMAMTCNIRDYGCGMSNEFQEHLFNPFEREHNKYSDERPGTGLGLAIVKNMIDMMGGSIVCHSKLDEGTEFEFKLVRELRDCPPEPSDINGGEDGFVTFENKRILLAEDNELNAYIAKNLLEKANMIVDVCVTGKKAVYQFAQAEEFCYDAILMDVRMPVMDGIQATKIIRGLNKADAKMVPIIAMTADAFTKDKEATMAAGMDAHLSKPIEPGVLFDTLRKYIK